MDTGKGVWAANVSADQSLVDGSQSGLKTRAYGLATAIIFQDEGRVGAGFQPALLLREDSHRNEEGWLETHIYPQRSRLARDRAG